MCIDEVGEEVHLVAFGGERKRERERRRGGDAQGWWGNGEVEKRIISEEGEGEGLESVRRFRKSVRKRNVRMFDNEWCRRERHTSSECREA